MVAHQRHPRLISKDPFERIHVRISTSLIVGANVVCEGVCDVVCEGKIAIVNEM